MLTPRQEANRQAVQNSHAGYLRLSDEWMETFDAEPGSEQYNADLKDLEDSVKRIIRIDEMKEMAFIIGLNVLAALVFTVILWYIILPYFIKL